MPSIEKLLASMWENPRNVRFSDLVKVCVYYFGSSRKKGSHHFFSVPWQGKPLANIQDANGKAKEYQVKQVLLAIDILKGMSDV